MFNLSIITDKLTSSSASVTRTESEGKWKSPLGHWGTVGLGKREGEVILGFKYYSNLVMVALIGEKKEIKVARGDIEGSEEMKLSNNPYGDVLSLSSYGGISGTGQHRSTDCRQFLRHLYYTICIIMNIS